MKPLSRRESFIAVVLTSAVAAVVLFWATSYWYSFAIGWERSHTHPVADRAFWGFYIQRGQVGFGRSALQADSLNLLSSRLSYKDSEAEHRFVFRAHGPRQSPWVSWGGTTTPDTILGRMGFETVHSTQRYPGAALTDRAVLVPWWFVFVVALLITIRWTFFRERRLHWGKVGRCAACGYDLRESTGRCPECGQVIGAPGDEGQSGADQPPAIVPARENRENL